MPFLLYKKAEGLYVLDREVKLAGYEGPMFKFVRDQRIDAGGWHMSESQLLNHLDSSSVEGELLIDLKPNVKNNVSMYAISDVWGYKYPDWCPLALRLREMLVDVHSDDPELMKKKFKAPGSKGKLIHEFLYLRENWTWGMVGRVNGALLWPESFKFFVNSISSSLPSDF